MSEKAACPRCDSYVSQVYYDGCHEWCGWNCRIDYEISAYGERGHAEVSVSAKPSPTFRSEVAALVGADETTVTVLVNSGLPDLLSAWLDPDKPDPGPLSERKQKANLQALKKHRLDNARRAIDADLGG